jgi:hypothetical protein
MGDVVVGRDRAEGFARGAASHQLVVGGESAKASDIRAVIIVCHRAAHDLWIDIAKDVLQRAQPRRLDYLLHTPPKATTSAALWSLSL